MRDYPSEARALAEELDSVERAFLPHRDQRTIEREYPAIAAVLDDAVRADEATRRAARVRPPWAHLPEISLATLIRCAELNFRAVGQGERWEQLTAPGRPVFG